MAQLPELDYDFNIHNAQQAAADANLAVRFFTGPIQNDHKSLEEGRPMFDDVVQVEIRVRGDRNNIVVRPMRDDDKRRFRDAWNMYKDGEKSLNDGTPLAQWPIMSTAMVEELKFLGFYTVEQVSQANDSVCGRVPGLTSMKQKALAYMEFAKGYSPIEKLQAQADKEKARADAAENQVKELGQMMQQMQAQINALASAQAGGRQEVMRDEPSGDLASRLDAKMDQEPPKAVAAKAPVAAKTK